MLLKLLDTFQFWSQANVTGTWRDLRAFLRTSCPWEGSIFRENRDMYFIPSVLACINGETGCPRITSCQVRCYSEFITHMAHYTGSPTHWEPVRPQHDRSSALSSPSSVLLPPFVSLCMLLFNFVNYAFLLLCLCILTVMYVLFCIFYFHRANWHPSAILTVVFPSLFPQF